MVLRRPVETTGAKRTKVEQDKIDAIDPIRTSGATNCCPAKKLATLLPISPVLCRQPSITRRKGRPFARRVEARIG